MDAFTRRVELDNGDEVADLTQSQPLQPPYGGDGDPVAAAAAGDDTGASTTTPDDDQVVPGQEHHLGPLMRRRHPLYEAPEFVQRLNVFEEVEQGGGLGFECQVRGFPRPVVKWFKDDVEVPPSQSEDGRIAAEEWPPVDASTSVSVSAGGGSGSIIVLLRLVIRDARKDDEGAYRCKAENEEGVAATTGYLSITGAPPSPNSSSSSPRANAVSAPPLLRAITEHQSMEEREAADYQLRAAISGSGEEDYEYEGMPDVGAAGSQLGWTYVDYMTAAGLDPGEPPEVGDSGSDTSVEVEAEDDRIVVVDHPSTASAAPAAVPRAVAPWTGSSASTRGDVPESGDPETAEVGSVNVFVVENRETGGGATDDGTPHSDMKPLLVRPSVPLSEHATTADDVPVSSSVPTVSGPAAAFQAVEDDSFSSSAVTRTVTDDVFRPVEAADGGREAAAIVSHTTDVAENPADDVGPPETVDAFPAKEPPKEPTAAVTEAEKPSVATAPPRPVLELSLTAAIDFCAGWFEHPWIAYLAVLVLSTLAASATEADPAALIVAVLVASAFCFIFFPPPSDFEDDDAAEITSPQ